MGWCSAGENRMFAGHLHAIIILIRSCKYSCLSDSIVIQTLVSNPLLLLFLVTAIGYPIGLIRIGGSSLGVAAVLFVGLFFGALDPALKLPEILYQFGLVLFVYTIGLSSGPGFFRAIQQRGLRDSVLVAAIALLVFGIVIAMVKWLGLSPTYGAGLYAGGLTNTPALAGAVEYLKLVIPAATREAVSSEPVVGYSIAYPIGVLGMIFAIQLAQRIFKPDYRREARNLREFGAIGEALYTNTVRIECPEAVGHTVLQFAETHQLNNVVFVRLKHADSMALVTGQTVLNQGDLISLLGDKEDVDRVAKMIGTPVEEALAADGRVLTYRRMFVSSNAVAGRRIGDLHLPDRYGALVTRVRRGDMDLLANGSTILEPGDMVRVVSLRERQQELSEFFGDSYRALSEIDVLTFGIGLVLGLLLGNIPVPLPGGTEFRLGIAGGPLIVSLILGYRGRTGPFIWALPYSANLTIRQVGLLIFLASIGTRAGYAFVSTLAGPGGLGLLAMGAAVTLSAAALLLIVGHFVLRIPMSLLIGMLAGLQTNPAVLGYATSQTRNDLPNIGYATVYPVAMIAKIILAQLIIILMR